ncbi:retroviral-like aspartic protease family protein [Tenacibaculum dicentrarchi]|nr:retroviral-like aspartic protease family protein [Tenacibaculum dicentrarchi]MCD8425986.1 retroviral-like aspartic protease family protein [Tenacibaculum dicentrarchi]
MKKIFIITTILLCAFKMNAQTKIIMSKKNGIYTVPCTVNGLPLKFIFDTGASDVSISLTEALFMLKNGHLKKEDIGESVYYSIANGDVAKGTKINLKEIEFAGLTLYNIKASIVHETSAPLLLGQSVISKLGKIQLEGNELTILNKDLNSYDYSNKQSKNSGDYVVSSTSRTYSNEQSFEKVKQIFPNIYPYNKNFSGKMKVYTNSPILKNPNMVTSESIGMAENKSVTILSKHNNGYYRVKSGNITGYLSTIWFK